MGIISILLGILTLFFVILPIIGMVFLIRYVIKKSSSKQPPQVLANEKQELIAKTRSKKSELVQWQPAMLEKISNNIDYNYSKGITRKFNGFIKTLQNEPIIAFRKIDRGAMDFTSRIMAITSAHELYFNQSNQEITIEVNGAYLGKMVNKAHILDQNNQPIGSFTRNESQANYYTVTLYNQELAYVVKNSDRRTLVKNPFHKAHAESSYQKEVYFEQDVSYANLLKLNRQPNDKEYQWILAIVVYEAIFYGIDFTR